MTDPDLFLLQYIKMGVSDDTAQEYRQMILSLKSWLEQRGVSLNDAKQQDLRKYLNHLIRTDQNSIDSVLILKEYYFAAGRIDLMVYFSEITDFIQVFDDIIDRVEELAGWEAAHAIRCVDPSPPVGTDPHVLPAYTARFLGLLFRALPMDVVRKALPGKDDDIIPTFYKTELSLYQNSVSMDEYLFASARLAEMKYRVMLYTGSKWSSLFFPKTYVDSASLFQEMLSGVRRGDTIFVTQEPLLPGPYQKAKSLARRRYFACRDPFVRASLLKDGPTVSVVWCERCVYRCKRRFEYLLGRPLRAEVLECALLGDTLCRFAVHLDEPAPDLKSKK